MEYPEEVVFPNRNVVLIALRVEESGGRISFTFLDFPLDISDGSV